MVGGSHNSLVVVIKDSLVVFDAPVSDWQSNWTLSTLRAKYLGKPVKYLVLDSAREVQVHAIEPNPRAQGLLIGYVPDARLAFVTDIWSPGGPLPDKLNPGFAALVAGVKKAGIQPVKFAGGHGSTGDYAPLAALEGK